MWLLKYGERGKKKKTLKNSARKIFENGNKVYSKSDYEVRGSVDIKLRSGSLKKISETTTRKIV